MEVTAGAIMGNLQLYRRFMSHHIQKRWFWKAVSSVDSCLQLVLEAQIDSIEYPWIARYSEFRGGGLLSSIGGVVPSD